MSELRGVDTFLAIKEQVDLNTEATAGSLVAGDYLAFNNEALSGQRQIVQSRAIRKQAVRSRIYTGNGTISAGGQVEFTASQVVLDKLLKLAFHTTTPVVGSGAGVGVSRKNYGVTAGGKLTPFTTFVGLGTGVGAYTRIFKGCKISSFSVSSKMSEFLTTTADIAGIDKRIVPGVSTAVYVDPDIEYAYLFDGAEVFIKAGDMTNLAQLPVSSFDLQIAHNLDVNDYRLGSIQRQGLAEGMVGVTGNFEIRPGKDSVNGTALNLTGGVLNDAAFVEKLNLEGKYASLKINFRDITRLVTVAKVVTLVGQTLTVDDAALVNVGDTVVVNGTTLAVTTKLGAVLTVVGTATAVATDKVEMNPVLTIDLPAIRLQEPSFNIKDENALQGSAAFEAFDDVKFTHLLKN